MKKIQRLETTTRECRVQEKHYFYLAKFPNANKAVKEEMKMSSRIQLPENWMFPIIKKAIPGWNGDLSVFWPSWNWDIMWEHAAGEGHQEPNKQSANNSAKPRRKRPCWRWPDPAEPMLEASVGYCIVLSKQTHQYLCKGSLYARSTVCTDWVTKQISARCPWLSSGFQHTKEGQAVSKEVASGLLLLKKIQP